MVLDAASAAAWVGNVIATYGIWRARHTNSPQPTPGISSTAPDTRSLWPLIRRSVPDLDRILRDRNATQRRLRLLLALDEQRSAAARVALVGPPGVGKSALARRVYAQWADEFEGVWWADGSSPEQLRADLTELAARLGLSVDGGHLAAARRACDALAAKRDPWLIIIDNVEALSALTPYLPTGPNLRLIITTTRRDLPEAYRVVEIERLDPATDGAALLRSEADRGRDPGSPVRRDNADGPQALARLLDGLPLALIIAGAWLRGDPEATYADLAARLEAVATDEPPTDYPRPLAAAVEALIDRLAQAATGEGSEAEVSADALAVMRVASYLAPIDVDAAFLAGCGGASDVPAQAPRLRRALQLLQAASLAEAGNEGAVRLHRLTQAVVRARAAREQRSNAAAAAAALAVEAGYPAEPQYSVNWRASAVADQHLGAMNRHCPDAVPLEPLYRAAVFHLGFGSVTLADHLICKYRDRIRVERPTDRHARFRCLVAMIDLNLRRGTATMAERLMRSVDHSMGGATSEERAVIAAILLDLKSQDPQPVNGISSEALFRHMAKEAQKACAVLRRPTTVWVNRLTSALLALSRCRAALGQTAAAIRLNRRARRNRLRYAPTEDCGYWALDAEFAEHLAGLGHFESALVAAEAAINRFKDSPSFDRDAGKYVAGLNAALLLVLVKVGVRGREAEGQARAICERFGLTYASIQEGAEALVRNARARHNAAP